MFVKPLTLVQLVSGLLASLGAGAALVLQVRPHARGSCSAVLHALPIWPQRAGPAAGGSGSQAAGALQTADPAPRRAAPLLQAEESSTLSLAVLWSAVSLVALKCLSSLSTLQVGAGCAAQPGAITAPSSRLAGPPTPASAAGPSCPTPQALRPLTPHPLTPSPSSNPRPPPRPAAQTHQNDLNRVMTALQYECARDSQEGVIATLLDGLADQQAKEVGGRAGWRAARAAGSCSWWAR